MYSEKIRPKVEKMFNELRAKVDVIISETNSANEAASKIARIVSSETASRSKSILSDMLFDLNDALFETPFFSDAARKNKFREINLRQEILDKYQFATSTTVDFDEATNIVRTIKVAGVTALGVSAVGIGVVLIQGLSVSSLVAPIPIGILVVATLGVALADYLRSGANRNKNSFSEAVRAYLYETQQQFLNWFDEVERYFNRRTEEIKHTI